MYNPFYKIRPSIGKSTSFRPGKVSHLGSTHRVPVLSRSSALGISPSPYPFVLGLSEHQSPRLVGPRSARNALLPCFLASLLPCFLFPEVAWVSRRLRQCTLRRASRCHHTSRCGRMLRSILYVFWFLPGNPSLAVTNSPGFPEGNLIFADKGRFFRFSNNLGMMVLESSSLSSALL